ncbi:uncharacterized protein LOC125959599 [Anopheles darlingi]|uniref:uncharacterized protein LOC125959599 n=1 Tax=Anopheles darlingi TaxID=43151 RepID=UPI0021004456|nr:uncharacterized protein LOC125959599 [Anopheles darlingi]
MAKLRSIFRKHLIPNLESKCRLCLSDKAIVHSIFQSDSTKEATDTLVEKIFECTAIMLSKDYDFPSPICEDCALKLDEFLLFRAKCLRSNEIYRFNRLHKQRFLFAGLSVRPSGDDRKSPTASPANDSECVDGEQSSLCTAPTVTEQPGDEDSEHVVRYRLPLATICEASGSSSSDSRTVIDTEQQQRNGTEKDVSGYHPEKVNEREEDLSQANTALPVVTEWNGESREHLLLAEGEDKSSDQPMRKSAPGTDDSECTSRLSPAPVVLLLDDTDTTNMSEEEGDGAETIPLSEMSPFRTDDDGDGVDDMAETPTGCLEGVRFPIETVEQLDQLERLVRTCDVARDRYIRLLRQLKTPNTSLSETYQQLFADRLLIHYNYDGISPKYNKRPLKTLILFTDCMVAAWCAHMDEARVKEAVIQAVRKSHNRYNQSNHRKVRKSQPQEKSGLVCCNKWYPFNLSSVTHVLPSRPESVQATNGYSRWIRSWRVDRRK